MGFQPITLTLPMCWHASDYPLKLLENRVSNSNKSLYKIGLWFCIIQNKNDLNLKKTLVINALEFVT